MNPMNIVFKQHLKVFLRDHMRIGETYMRKLDECKDYYDLMDFLGDHGERIADSLCIEIDVECEECWSKDHMLDELQEKIDSLPGRFESMDEDRKFETFLQYQRKFTPSELEDLMR